MRRPILAATAALLGLLAGCGGDDAKRTSGLSASGSHDVKAPPRTATVPSSRPEIELYEPLREEQYANGKRLAARVAQRALTYGRDTSAREVAASLGPSSVGRERLARVLEPVVDPEMRSAGEVLYPQLSGVTQTSLGVMVVARQRLQDRDGRWRSVTRVIDVRLKRAGGPWSLDRIASVGGARAKRPSSVSKEAERVLDHPDITLSDSARWDIYRGGVDSSLLRTLADVAEDQELSIAVIDSGHPPNVWATDRLSAHSKGYAADIYAVDGRAVIRQREVGSPAHDLARALLARGAFQLGSPWDFGGGGPRSFTDRVHQDHIHVQQSPAALKSAATARAR